MKHLSKVILFLNAIFLAFLLVACSADEDSATTKETDSTSTKTESYVITFNPNGGTIVSNKQTIESSKETNIASASALGLSYGSMKFIGWALTSSASEATYGDGAKIILSKNITLYAVWKDTSSKITITTSEDTIYKGNKIVISVEFENFTETPSTVDVYESNQSEPIATSVSVTDGKISFLSTGLNAGSYNFYVQRKKIKSNTTVITILEKTIQITAISENVPSGATVELSVSFKNFNETPTTVDVYESNRSEPIAKGVSVTDGKISFSTASLDTGLHSFFVQAGNTKSNIVSITIPEKAIQITTVSENILSGATAEISISFENFAETPSSVDVYESNISITVPIATGISVTDGKISFSSAGLNTGLHSFFVQTGNTKSNTVSITIPEKAIQITAVSEKVPFDAAVELSVSFENFIETPTTVDVYNSYNSKLIATGICVADDKISFSFSTAGLGSYNFYVKSNGITSNVITIRFVKKEIKLEYISSTYVGNTIDIPIEFLNYTEEPTCIDVYKSGESTPFLTNISVSNDKISIPLSLNLENSYIYVKADSEKSNELRIGYVGLLNQDGSYSVTIRSLESVAHEVATQFLDTGDNYTFTFNIIGECTSENLKDSDLINRYTFNTFINGRWELNLSEVTGLTKIDNSTFSGLTTLTKVIIPDTVTKIEDQAFSGCTSLSSIKLPDTLTDFGDQVFVDCTSLSSINIPKSLTYIPAETFIGCSSLTSIVIPDTVTKIMDSAFSGCTSLSSIILPETLTDFGDYVFSGCTSLTGINIPKSLTYIPSGIFAGCSSLSSIVIPDTITKIESSAFYGCSSLKSITIPDTVTEIINMAFSGCTSLTSINMPRSLTKIGAGAFAHCSGLTSITIPDTVTEIGDRAFADCSGLTSITIPDTVTEIGGWAFADCSNLTNAKFESTSNWYWRSYINTKEFIDEEVSSSSLENEEAAANLLKESHIWIKK